MVSRAVQQHDAVRGNGDVDEQSFCAMPASQGEAPGDLVSLYAARASATGIDVRRIVAAGRAGVAARHQHRSSVHLVVREPIAIGRGTAGHRDAVERSSGLRGLVSHLRDASHRRPAPQSRPAPAGSFRRRLAAASLALTVVFAGVGGVLAQPRTGLQPAIRSNYVAAPVSTMRNAAVASTSLDVLSARTASGSLPLPTGVTSTYQVVGGDTLARIATSYGVSVDSLATLNALADPNVINAGQELLIPATDIEPAAAQSVPASSAGQAWVSTVGTYVQQRNLSCEYAASFIATAALGAGVEEWVFWDQVPAATNPHYGYRGNIDGRWGNTDDYGVYPEALAPVLNANGYGTEPFYSLGDPAALKRQLDLGRPVVVWLGLWGDTGETLWDDGRYTVASGAHVVTAYGYDAWGVYVSDPATGSYRAWSWNDFTPMWNVLDGMSMAVYPY
jgi:LysM repeat protein